MTKIAINTCRSIRRDRWFRYVDSSVTAEALPLKIANDEDRALMEAVMSLPNRLKEVVLLYCCCFIKHRRTTNSAV
ncbi:MAG: hypothetical protein RSE23_13810 [Clostridia bacterium]